MKTLKHLTMIVWFFLWHASGVSRRLRWSLPRPFAGCPDWAVGIVMLTFDQSRAPESRLLYAAACAEWATRQVERKLLAALQAEAHSLTTPAA